jgi:hypothetical protein
MGTGELGCKNYVKRIACGIRAEDEVVWMVQLHVDRGVKPAA